jgi:LuxR family maltose regulon positive regulatory protein
MQRTIPRVNGELLYQSETERDSIGVGTPAWYDWLEQHTAFTFVDTVGTFTARKSMLRSRGSYWKAYRKRQGKLYRIHLGHSHALTLERLQAAARAFAGEHVSGKLTDASSTQPAASMHPRLPRHTSPRMALDVDHPMTLIQTKCYRPRTRSDLISRARLLERLNGGLNGKVTLVAAPAGFGKTTVLAQWVQTIDRPSAWLSLDEHDNELVVFVRSLTAALQSAFPDAFGATASLLKAPRSLLLPQIVALLIYDLAEVPDDIILVLDDYHLIYNNNIHTLLDLLIEHLPLQLHLVLATRTDPPLPLVRWHARGYLNELRSVDLRFTLEETEAFLTGVLGSIVAHETAGAFEERTEGWIAVLRLATLSLRNIPDFAAFMERLQHAPDHLVSSYLVEEVLSQQTPTMQMFLEQTSILEQICAELCVAVMGNADPHEHVQATLDWLVHSNLFLVPLDERHGWYRFHHLFGHLLQQRLQAHSSRDEIATLHQRASAWYAEQGLIEQAIEHALVAGDGSSATHLVEARFLPAFKQEQLVQSERWLRLLPEEQILCSPVLLFARAWSLGAHGQHKDFPHVLTTAEQLLEMNGSSSRELDDPGRRVLHALIAVQWSEFYYFKGQVQASLESARSSLAWLPSGEEYVAIFPQAFQAWSNQALGNEDVALVALQQALRDHSSHLNATARLLFALGIVYLTAGKLPQVEHTARHLLQITQNDNLVLSQQFAHWFLGVVSYEQNKLDTAVYHFSVVVANQHLAHLWVVRDAMCGVALAYQAQGLDTQAQEAARSLLELMQGQNNMSELLVAYAFCGQLALLQNEVEEASQWLEMAGEQEVQGPMWFIEDPPLTTARLLLARGDEVSVSRGQALLADLVQHVEAIHSTRKTIQVLALQAWAYDLQGRVAEALEVLERALALAYPGGFIRTFADLPPLAKVLHELRKRRKERKEVDRKVDTYLQHILAAMNSRAAPPVSMEALLQQEGLEPLTDRELQILHLLDQDLTNKQIAHELVVTTGTVKVHTNNVYRKLSVNNRRAAVSLAKALGYMAAG